MTEIEEANLDTVQAYLAALSRPGKPAKPWGISSTPIIG